MIVLLLNIFLQERVTSLAFNTYCYCVPKRKRKKLKIQNEIDKKKCS